WSCGVTRTDGPDGFVGDGNFRKLLFGETGYAGGELANENVGRVSRFVIFEALSHADDGRQAGVERSLCFLEHVRIGFVEVLAALAMADENPSGSGGAKHLARNLTGEGAFFAPIEVLASNVDRSVANGADGSWDRDADGKNHDFALRHATGERF